jgi:IS1 family transposase
VAFFAFKKNKVWVWKAYCRTTGELVDWECGNRRAQILRKMLDRLEQLEVKVFFADNWEAYAELIPASCLFRQKLRLRGWSVIFLGNGIGVGVFVVRLVWFQVYV